MDIVGEVADIEEPEAEAKNEPSEIEKNEENDEIIIEPIIKQKESEETNKSQTIETSSDLEFEVSEPVYEEDEYIEKQPVKEESVTNEAYLKFENKFFEDVKII